ncbi:SusD-like protein [Formosa agariphila KMM 3901]|uniref:SusD-like protein P25 n=1 Tax=Formosa agariphila (strain DSM 15362 / KCTC 12365 / LMG 23005 / KMM 3901 / M-2Alg 35-1) TaxID=1347342 RepID=PLH25_FORAG|nr:RagB/SusD family nutrient uptake outer membrane protein [Formosa agariphila]T2KNB8.1 RecName: Full=SusD-like protein P25; Short=P25_SusD; AltName: Full=Polysaccharide utilization locus H protein P25; Short=PUL H protein P25; Flags: Precursor [Formosa agariphila KMM 3901]CDF79926.1 SusD-like protein [Formosa agariphila KMM 3901]
MKIQNIIVYVFLIFSCFSCEEFLEEDPRALIAPETFYQSESDVRQAVVGLYSILKNNSIYGQLGLDLFYDNGADIIEPNRSTNVVEPLGNYSLNEAIADVSVQKMSVSDTWKDLYRVIYNANIILDNVDGNDAISEEAQIDIMAEVKFIRALCYWHIVNLWGDAPFYTEPLVLEEIRVLGRTDEDTILSTVVSDLQYAQVHLASVYPEEDRGRASKWAAAIVEAKIHMQEQNWQAGLNKCMEIISQSPHSLLGNYADVFNPNNEYNSEIIWSLDFAKDIRGQFEEGTLGADGSFPSVFGNGNWRPSMFAPRLRDEPKNSSERNALAAALQANGEAFNGTGLQVASKDFAGKFPRNDYRRALNIVDNYLGFDLNFPYMAKIWNLDVDNSPRFNHSDNRIVFRLADVYLMAAECENELNGPANAFQYINKVRERAFATQTEWELKGLDQQGFREAIYDERKWELAGECHRRYDLIRWGILLDVVQDLEYRFWTPNTNIRPYHVKLPIPLQELQVNPVLLESDATNNGYR